MSACRRHDPGRIDGTDSLIAVPSTSAFPTLQLGQLLHYQFRGLLAFTHVTTYRLAKSPYATLYTGGSDGFVASTVALIATGWSDPVPGRVYLPLWSSAFHGAL